MNCRVVNPAALLSTVVNGAAAYHKRANIKVMHFKNYVVEDEVFKTTV